MAGSGGQRPLPPYIYRRRRLAMLAMLVTVLAVIVVAFNSCGSGGTSKPTPTASVSPSTSAVPEADVTKCVDSAVEVTVSTDKPTYAAGEQPQLTIHVRNTGTVACTFNAGTAVQVLRISGQEKMVWLSTDCQTESSNAMVELQPGVVLSSAAPVIWDRTISSPSTCNVAREAVPAGGATYYFEASVNNVGSESSVSFTLN